MTTRVSQLFGRSAYLNETRRDTRNSERDGQSKGTGISFTSSATIGDTNSSFGFAVGEKIDVRGSATNSRRFEVTAASSSSLTVVPAMVTSESAGGEITVLRAEC